MILSKNARLLMCDGKYKTVQSVREGNAFLDHCGKMNQIMTIKPVSLNAYITFRSRKWYVPTKIPIEMMVLTKQNKTKWEYIYNLEIDSKLQSPKLITLLESTYGAIYTDLDRTTDNFDVGRFIGRFLAIGGFDDHDTNPYLYANSSMSLGSNVKIYKKAFPILGFTYENYKLYIDMTIFSFLWNIYTDPLLFIMSNKTKTFLMMGVKYGILEGLKADVFNNNMSSFLMEKLYIIDEALGMKTNEQYSNCVKEISANYESDKSDECIEFESKYKSSFIVNNVIMQSASMYVE